MNLKDLIQYKKPEKEQDFEEFGNEASGRFRILKRGWFTVPEAMAWDNAMMKYKQDNVEGSGIDIMLDCVTAILQQRVDIQWSREDSIGIGSLPLLSDLFDFFNRERNQHKPPEQLRFEGFKAREVAISYAKQNGGVLFTRKNTPYVYVVFEDTGAIAPEFLLEWDLVEIRPDTKVRKNT